MYVYIYIILHTHTHTHTQICRVHTNEHTHTHTHTQDPREALLQYAEDAAKDPFYMNAYKETQPETQFDTGEERMEKRAKPYWRP